MARQLFEHDPNFSLEKEFESELDLRSEEPARPEEDPQFDDRLRPDQSDTKPERGGFDPKRRPIWPEDDTPKKGRVSRTVYLAFLVVLALGAVWVLERDIAGPPAYEQAQATNETPAAAEPPPLPTREPDAVVPNGDLVASRELGEPPASNPPTSRSAAAPTSPTTATTPRPTVGPRVTTSAGSTDASRANDASRQPRPAPPERRLNLEPPARPPYRSIPEPTPPRPATVPPAPPAQAATPPAPAPVAPSSSPAQATTSPSPGQTTTSPSPPRTAVTEVSPAPLPRVAVDEPTLRPPATPPPQPATPAAVAPPPAAAARPPAASPTPALAAADVDSGAIRDVLGRYRNAFNSLDARAAQQVWPTVNQRNLDRAFGQLQEQSLSFDRCTIAVKGVLAEANCSGTTRFVPRVGSRAAQTEQRQWNFSLRKAYEGGWLIQNVEAR